MASTLETGKNLDEFDALEGVDFPDDTLGLTDQQWDNINKQLNDAVKAGAISENERNGARQLIAQIPQNMRGKAEKIVEKKLKKKAEYEQEHRKKVEEAQEKGWLSEKEAEKLLKDYHKLSGGKKRKKATDKLEKDLKIREAEKTQAEDLVDQSPHFNHQGKRTKEAETFIKRHATLDEGGKKKEKIRLLNRINQLDNIVELCEDREKQASELYSHGEYYQALLIMKRNKRFTDRYPESIRLQEVNKKAEVSITNLEYELEEQEKIREAREDRDDEVSVENADHSLNLSNKLIHLADHMVGFTKSHDEGLIPRDPKWVTDHMSEQQREAKEKHEELEQMYQTFAALDEQAEDQSAELDDFRRQELAKDAILQTHAKSYADIGKETDEDESPTIEHHGNSTITSELEEGAEVQLDQSERNLQQDEADKLLRTDDVQVTVQKKGQTLEGSDAEQQVADNMLSREENLIRKSNLSEEAKEAELQRLKEARQHRGGRIAGALWNKLKGDSRADDLITTGDRYNAEKNQETMADIISKSASKEDKQLQKEQEQDNLKRKAAMLEQVRKSA